MSTKLKVLRFNPQRMCSECEVLFSPLPGFYKGKRLWVDLTVDAGFEDMPEADLVGKVVEVNGFQACEYIGVGVRLVDTEDENKPAESGDL